MARQALELLAGAERPVILVGNGATLSEAAPEVRRLAEVLGAPVANTPQGAGQNASKAAVDAWLTSTGIDPNAVRNDPNIQPPPDYSAN